MDATCWRFPLFRPMLYSHHIYSRDRGPLRDRGRVRLGVDEGGGGRGREGEARGMRSELGAGCIASCVPIVGNVLYSHHIYSPTSRSRCTP